MVGVWFVKPTSSYFSVNQQFASFAGYYFMITLECVFQSLDILCGNSFAISFAIVFGNTFSKCKGTAFFFDIHKFIRKKKLHIFSSIFPSGNSCTINYGIST